jgi:signal peptidase I
MKEPVGQSTGGPGPLEPTPPDAVPPDPAGAGPTAGVAPPEPPELAPGPARRGWSRVWHSWGAVVVVSVVIAVLLRTFVIGAFSIPSGSMIPTLEKGDRILVDRVAYDFHGVHRGDVVVFRPTQNLLCGTPAEEYLVKRVIGLPGDRISSRGNTIYISGRPLKEPWLPKNDPLGQQITPTTVPPGQYYMLGDNRGDSCDSRFWGTVPRSHLIGPADVRFWPPSRMHLF